MPDVKTYDPSQVSLLVGGAIIASWNSISVVRDEDGFTFTTDTSSGEATRTKNASKLGTITAILPQASGDNAVLSGFEVSGSVVSVAVIDNAGNSLAVMPKGTVVKIPDSEYAKESGEREWMIRGNLDVHVVGGNN